MTLTNRLSLFSLTALGAVLLGFSLTLFLLARSYLDRQLDERLEAGLNTLAACAEFGRRGGLEWEPQDRQLDLEPPRDAAVLRWVVRDEKGACVDRRAGPADDDLTPSLLAFSVGDRSHEVAAWHGERWRMSKRQIAPIAPPPADAARNPKRPIYSALIISAAISQRPVEQALQSVAATLAGVSVGIWLLAALAVRSLCRRALSPLFHMAQTARTIDAADLGRRLTETGTDDELEDLRQAFNELLGRVQQAFERQKRFTGDASHQLRTPLTVILGQLDVALRRERDPDEYRRTLNLVHDQAVRLRQIVEMLLFLARSEADARLPDLETVELVSWLETHLQSWSHHPRWADIHFHVSGGETFWVDAHPPMLGQLVDNLLENACKYSAAGTPIAVELSEGTAGDTGRMSEGAKEVRLTIADAGCGIAADDLHHLFEPFFRSADARRRGVDGIGLGLAIAKRIAVALGGRIRAYSEPGQGSRFVVELPDARKSVRTPCADGSLAGL